MRPEVINLEGKRNESLTSIEPLNPERYHQMTSVEGAAINQGIIPENVRKWISSESGVKNRDAMTEVVELMKGTVEMPIKIGLMSVIEATKD